MADDKLAELLKTQKSLTEWLQDIGHKDTEKLRHEDIEKRARLKVVRDIIGLPFDEPTAFPATEVHDNSPAFKAYLAEHGDELCVLHLLPSIASLPKLRMRGKTIANTVEWFFEQDIDATQYRASFAPHPPDYSWATIFVINEHGIQGEIIYGGHQQLTQGFHDGPAPHIFRYDFKAWHMLPHNSRALAHLKEIVKHLRVTDVAKQEELTEKLNSTFTHSYMQGYFETADSSMGLWFIDYSPSLGKMYADLALNPTASVSQALVHGQPGSNGTARGPVRIVDPEDIGPQDFPDGAILVCKVTTPNYIPLMKKAAAIVTDQGGILSHAAIVARELRVPCIVGTGNATTTLKDGQTITVDATAGDVFKSQSERSQ